MFKKIAKARSVSVFVTGIYLLTGCATFQPYVNFPDIPENATYSQVKQQARGVEKKFDDKLNQLEYYDFGTGLIQFGAAIAVAGFGIFDAHDDAILGAGLVGASAIGARSFLPIQQRKEIYIRGASAIECAITVTIFGSTDDNKGKVESVTSTFNTLAAKTSTLMSASPTRIAAGSLVTTLQNLESFTSSIQLLSTANGKASAQGRRLMSAVDSASDAGEKAKKAFSDVVTNQRARALEGALAAIVNSVKVQIVTARLDPNGAIQAANTHLTSVIEAAETPAKETVEKAEAAQTEAEQTKEEATNLKITGKAVKAMVAADSVDEDSADETIQNGEELTATAEDAEGILDDVKQAAEEILSATGVSKKCLAGLI